MKFTIVGFMVLGIVGLLLLSNEKTGPAVIFVLALMIGLLVLSHYKEMEQAMFQPST